MSLYCHCFWFLHSLVLFSIIPISPGLNELKSIQLKAPVYVRQGEPLTLTCQYDLDISSVYTVKWYHDGEEFYRYLPKENPPQQVFPKDGILVNVTFSNDRQVVLTTTSRDTSGKFKCSVSAELTFKTLEDTQNVTVVVVGYDSPKLYIDQVEYSQGDTVQANCTIDRTWPPINITWFVNGVPVPDAIDHTSLKPMYYDPSLTSTISSVSFKVPETSFLLRLKCTGTLFDVYNMSSEMTMGLKPRRLRMTGTSHNSLRANNSTADAAYEFHHSKWWIQIFTQLTLHHINLLYLT